MIFDVLLKFFFHNCSPPMFSAFRGVYLYNTLLNAECQWVFDNFFYFSQNFFLDINITMPYDVHKECEDKWEILI